MAKNWGYPSVISSFFKVTPQFASCLLVTQVDETRTVCMQTWNRYHYLLAIQRGQFQTKVTIV